MGKNQRKVKAAGPLQHTATGGAAAQNGDFVQLTVVFTYVLPDGLGHAEYDERRRAFPEAEYLATSAGFRTVEEEFIAGEVHLGFFKGKVKKSNGGLEAVGFGGVAFRPSVFLHGGSVPRNQERGAMGAEFDWAGHRDSTWACPRGGLCLRAAFDSAH